MYTTPAEALAASPPPAGRVAIAIPDGTRPVDVAGALDALRAVLPGDPVAVIGLGLHRPMRADELPRSPFRLLQHDPDDTISIGVAHGVPGGVSRHLMGVDAIIGVGIVELHQYAGFSGGHKAVAVGCGARATLDALHHRDRVTAPGVEIGRLDGNPFRAAVDALGEAAGCRYVLQQAETGWLAGEPRATLAATAASLDCWQPVSQRASAAILRVKGNKAVNFYQASRAATYIGLSPAPPLVPGATLYLEATCPEGLGEGGGERAFAAVLAAGRPPWSEVLTGPAPDGAGAQRAVMLALLLQKYQLVVCGVTDPRPFAAVGLSATTASAAEVAPPDALVVNDPFHRLPIFSIQGANKSG